MEQDFSLRVNGQLCRCAAYPNILDAIESVAASGEKVDI